MLTTITLLSSLAIDGVALQSLETTSEATSLSFGLPNSPLQITSSRASVFDLLNQGSTRVTFGVDICSGATDDGEPCGERFNDPCNDPAGQIPNFLVDGQAITGNLYTFSELTDDDNPPTTPDVEGEFRDIDRFVYSHPGGSIDVTVLSEADALLNIGNLGADCSLDVFLYGWAVAGGAESTQTLYLPVGDYYMLATPATFEAWDCTDDPDTADVTEAPFVYCVSATSDPSGVCELGSAADDVAEIEPCGFSTNEGCNGTSIPFQFETITEGISIVGTSRIFEVENPTDPTNPGLSRDTDWYEFQHPGGGIQYNVEADYNFVGLIVDYGDCTSTNVVHVITTGPTTIACAPASNTSGYLPAGTYAIWASADFAGGAFECGNYRISVNVDDTVPPPDCDESSNSSCDSTATAFPSSLDGSPITANGFYSTYRGGATVGNVTWSSSYPVADLPTDAGGISCVKWLGYNLEGSPETEVSLYHDIDGGAPSEDLSDLDLLGTTSRCYAVPNQYGVFEAAFDSAIEVPATGNVVMRVTFKPLADGTAAGFVAFSDDLDNTAYDGYLGADQFGVNFVAVSGLGAPFGWLDHQLVFGGVGEDPCPTDLDDDGDTDFNDILIVLSNFGSDGSAGGDADEDGDVDFNDLITLLSAFGPCP
jgi:hypothetical protein